MILVIRVLLLVTASTFSLSLNAFDDPLKEAIAAYGQRDYATANNLWRIHAEQGNARAQYFLGNSYAHGEGVPQDYVEAFKWFRKAAVQGHVDAQHNLGALYAYGWGVSKDYDQASYWYHKSAEQGLALAQNKLGNLYYDKFNFSQAIKWFRMAAEQGDQEGQYNLGYILNSFDYSPDSEARLWMRKSMQGKDPKIAARAQNMLKKWISDDAAREQIYRDQEAFDHSFKCGTYVQGGASFGELSAMGCN
jgi:TPR repeat protein